ncbi:MAG: CcdB family protein [Pseudomonadota bacterium]
MSQFTVYKNEDKATKKTYPYFLNIQNNLLDELNSRVVMPFSTLASVKHRDAKKLCPVIMIEDKELILLAHQITTVPKSLLRKEIADISSFRSEIITAIDLLITGI